MKLDEIPALGFTPIAQEVLYMKAIKRSAMAVAAIALIGSTGIAQAAVLQIFDSATAGSVGGLQPHTVNVAEPPLPNFPWQIPTIAGGWPDDTDGYLRSYLYLAGEGAQTTTTVRFEYRGDGNSSLSNSFWVHDGMNYSPLFTESNDLCNSEQGAGNCATSGSGGARELILPVNTLISFAFFDGVGAFDQTCASLFTVCNDGSDNINSPDPDDRAHYFLAADNGTDPVTGARIPGSKTDGGLPYDNEGRFAWAGFSDRGGGDSDEQDFVVRISVVPEPGSLALVGLALAGLGLARRRKTA